MISDGPESADLRCPQNGRFLVLKICRKTTISRHCADVKFPVSYDILSSVSERKNKGMPLICWNGLKHVCLCSAV